MKATKTEREDNGDLIVRDLSQLETDEVYKMGRDEPYFCGFWDKEVIEAIPNSEDCYALTARVGKELAGFAITQYSPTLRKATWENLYVSSEYRKRIYRGTSVSRILSEEMIKKMQSIGATSINSLTETDNGPINNLLKNLGFEEVGNFVWTRKRL